MEEIFPKQPFIKRLEFVGMFQQGGKSTNGLHFVVQYDQIKVGDITGCIFGTTDTFKELATVYDSSGSELKMHSTDSGHIFILSTLYRFAVMTKSNFIILSFHHQLCNDKMIFSSPHLYRKMIR